VRETRNSDDEVKIPRTKMRKRIERIKESVKSVIDQPGRGNLESVKTGYRQLYTDSLFMRWP
jgi:hypothetical protein